VKRALSIKLTIEKFYGYDRSHRCMDGDCAMGHTHNWFDIIMTMSAQLVILLIFLAFPLFGLGIVHF